MYETKVILEMNHYNLSLFVVLTNITNINFYQALKKKTIRTRTKKTKDRFEYQLEKPYFI